MSQTVVSDKDLAENRAELFMPEPSKGQRKGRKVQVQLHPLLRSSETMKSKLGRTSEQDRLGWDGRWAEAQGCSARFLR
jgi:hypothetical protein